MRSFYRQDRRRIICAKTKKNVSREYIRNLIEEGIEIEYFDEITKEDLKENLFKGIKRKNIRWTKKDEENGIGPVLPLNPTKYNKCKSCGVKTVNRFNCTVCLDKVSDEINGDFIYHMYNSYAEEVDIE